MKLYDLQTLNVQALDTQNMMQENGGIIGPFILAGIGTGIILLSTFFFVRITASPSPQPKKTDLKVS